MIDFNMEAEQAVLGSILLDRSQETTAKAVECLEPEYFSEMHRPVFEAILDLYGEGTSIDILTLSNRLNDRGAPEDIGGIDYLGDLAEHVPSTANAIHYIKMIEAAGIRRKALEALEEQRRLIEEEVDPQKVVASFQAAAEGLGEKVRSERKLTRIHEVMRNHEDEIEARSQTKGITGVPTCGADLNKLTGGRQKGDLIIVAARPSMGKTAFMLNGSVAAANAGYATAIFSLEMPGKKLGERIIANIGNLDGSLLRTGNLGEDDWPKYTTARSILDKMPIYIDDTPGITIQEIAAKVKQLKKVHSELHVQIDYLQLINSGKKFQSREQEVAYISRTLKQIARDNDCPVEVLSQLSRGVEQRQDKHPMMSDLRESGSIEQDADEIDFLYRDDYYNAESEKKNIVEIIVAKGRNTGTGLAEMIYLKNYSRFCDIHRIQY
ncbi:replicative DNA helicase [Paenibacillus campinasensis]|uniref:Replicative DNA helicase n=1 Tax=Paenibacillus campinasensis TaxID=66347 RepID=A0A268EKN8_9BACL|nr:replicative DNA helicase [Paenibacillus campinasensis]PAD73690.1 replicative DNA helicase [Paenibacillus campinasensis]